MKTYKFEKVLQKDGWLGETYLSIDGDGIIQSISSSAPEGEIFPKEGALFPGFQNAHSHAFQYAMAGLSESLDENSKSDDFWSWRENMYNLALEITPQKMESIATDLYCEMVRHGYTHVAEFHYLHHDKDGSAYANLSEMSERLMNAATTAGILITIIPMFYQMGGFNLDANARQRRFLSKTLEDYLELFHAVESASKNYKNVNVGIGIHSLRAVKNQDIIDLFSKAPKNIPKHIHISEQISEVQDCVAHLKKRPLEWLIDNVSLDESFHLVHATHINQKEIDALIRTKAHVVLCPSTEANLGDGLFPLLEFHKQGGKFSIGTDSHIGLSPMEELRWLDYGVRLIEKKRNPLCIKDGDSSGDILYHTSYQAGLKAMGINRSNYFVVGGQLRGLLIDTQSNVFKNKETKDILNVLIFSGATHHLSRLAL